jgi:sugar phosphate isomerase/epimerase
VTTIAAASDELPYHENFERHRAQLGKVAQALAPHDIQLGLEFRAPARLREGLAFEFIYTFDALVKLAQSIGHDNVGVVIDTWHCHVGQTNIEEIQNLTAADIIAVYLSDAPAGLILDEADESDRLMLGETDTIDCAATLTALAELGFGGPVSIRCSRTGLNSISRDKLVRLAGERIDKVWKEAGLMSDGTLAVATGN